MLTLKRNKKAYNEFTLTLKGTAGKVLCIQNALEKHAESSPLAAEVLEALKRQTIVDGVDLLTV